MLRKLLFSLLPFAAIALLTSEQASQNGRAGYTGSPGESNCTNCHSSYTLNSGGGSITASCAMMYNWQYDVGHTYAISITVARSANSLFGFGVECLTSSGANAGTFTITDAAHTHILTRTVNSVVRQNVVHTNGGGAASGSKTFTFNWTAPATNVGNVTFYYSGIAANNNGSESGDYVYVGSQVASMMTTGVNDLTTASSSSVSVFPNPVSESMHVNYEIKNTGPVQIRLYDLSGKLVNELLNADRTTGQHTESFSDLHTGAPGVYFLQTIADGESRTQKILIQ